MKHKGDYPKHFNFMMYMIYKITTTLHITQNSSIMCKQVAVCDMLYIKYFQYSSLLGSYTVRYRNHIITYISDTTVTCHDTKPVL